MVGGWLALSCTQSPYANGNGTFEVSGEQSVFEGVGAQDALTAEERSTYASDRKYVRSLAPLDTPVSLNHADDRQHRFVLLRLKLAGKNEKTAPELLRMIADKRAEHLAMGFRPGTLATLDASVTRENKHYFGSVNVVRTATRLEALATGSVKDPLFYGYLDSGTWSDTGEPLSNMAFVEAYDNMPYRQALAIGNLTLAGNGHAEADSLLVKDAVASGYSESYVSTRQSLGPAQFTSIAQAPISTVGDACASVCLNRTWTGDCDYDLTGTETAFKLPLKGQVVITNGSFNATRVAQYKNGTAVDASGAPDPGGQVRVVLTNVGGGCDVSSDNSILLGMRRFWFGVTVSADGKTLSWDLTGPNAALFDPSCRQVQDSVELAMSLRLPFVEDGTAVTDINNFSLTNSQRTDVDPATKKFPCIRVTNSCFAAGTLVAMGDGKAAPVEGIQIGDTVHNPFDTTDSALMVSDTARGFEREPMVRIEDERGQTLMMTEMHPMPVVGRGMVLARQLKVGDQVTTRQGPSRLKQVTRVPYDGQVYNLKVGSQQELSRLGEDQTVLYANGFLVGDGQIQAKYEKAELVAQKAKVKLPVRWKKDYQTSARR